MDVPKFLDHSRGRIWVDVTTLTRWEGRWTGIPRTTASLVHEWLKREDPPLLCRFDADTHQFLPVERDVFEAMLDQQVGDDQLPAGAREPFAPARSLKQRVKEGMNWLPDGLKDALRATVAAARLWARCVVRPAKSLLRCGQVGPSIASDELPLPLLFQEGDTLLSPGGSWEDQSYLPVLDRLKRTIDLRVVPIIYDLIPHLLPHFFPSEFAPLFRSWLGRFMALADQAIVISENTRADLLEFLDSWNIPAPPVDVIRLGDRHPFPGRSHPPVPFLHVGWPPPPFALVVGTVEVRKNHALLYQAWLRLIEEHGEKVPPLVIAGQRGWLCSELLHQIENDPRIAGKIIRIERLTDGELTWLYENCLFTLYPSHYEGWGLPVSESLSHGKYCIASDRSSLKEVGGHLIDYHDPLDFLKCKHLIERALFEEEYLPRKEAEIRLEYARTTWRDSADALWSILRSEPLDLPERERQFA